MLLAGAVGDGTTADVRLPPLSDAAVVFFSGTSAGSDGVIAHADDLSARLAPYGTRVVAIADAQHTPPADLLPDHADALEAAQVARWDSLVASGTPPYVDASCAASGAAPWQCYDLTYVLTEHVTTPAFVRQDLRDVTDQAEKVGVTEDEFEVGAAGMLDRFAARGHGVYGPNCAQHVALEVTDWWRVHTVADGAGTAWTLQDAVQAWFDGGTVAVRDEPVVGPGSGPASDCGP
ncbi:MAG: hypothetical protein R3F59_34990 [Myxococcota bacterium]